MKGQILLALSLLAACTSPDENEVRATFLADNPTAIIESIGPGEGDDSNVYLHIRYRVPGDSTLWENVWLYQKGVSGRWQLTSKGSAREPAPRGRPNVAALLVIIVAVLLATVLAWRLMISHRRARHLTSA
jgi:hypothetical protein